MIITMHKNIQSADPKQNMRTDVFVHGTSESNK